MMKLDINLRLKDAFIYAFLIYKAMNFNLDSNALENKSENKISQKLNVTGGPGSLVKFALLNREKILAAPELTYIK